MLTKKEGQEEKKIGKINKRFKEEEMRKYCLKKYTLIARIELWNTQFPYAKGAASLTPTRGKPSDLRCWSIFWVPFPSLPAGSVIALK